MENFVKEFQPKLNKQEAQELEIRLLNDGNR